MNHSAARTNYDRLSRWYDGFSASERRPTRAGLEMLKPLPGQCILEIGCGTGHALVWLADRGLTVVGLDLSAGMLSRSKYLVTAKACQHVALCQGDALSLPFPAQTFHAIFLSFTLELFSEAEMPHLLGEIHRTLSSEGQLGIVALRQENTLAVHIYDWFHHRWPHVVDCRPIQLQASLIQAGFTICASRRMSIWGLPVEILTSVRS